MNVDYAFTTDRLGRLDLRLVGGYLHRLDFIGTPGAPVTDNVDQAGRPKYTFDFSPTWTLGDLSVNYNLRWQDGTRIFDRVTTQNDPNVADRLRYSELWQHDIQVGYDLPSGFGIYGGVLNLTDQQPDPGNAINQPISAIGRTFYIGVKVTPDFH